MSFRFFFAVQWLEDLGLEHAQFLYFLIFFFEFSDNAGYLLCLLFLAVFVEGDLFLKIVDVGKVGGFEVVVALQKEVYFC